jgi:hypothetical protein
MDKAAHCNIPQHRRLRYVRQSAQQVATETVLPWCLHGLNGTYIIRTAHCVKQLACLNFGGNATGGPGSDNGSWAWLNVSASCSIL